MITRRSDWRCGARRHRPRCPTHRDRLHRRRRRALADFPLGVELEVFIRPEDAERFIEEVRGDEPEIAGYRRTAERASEARG